MIIKNIADHPHMLSKKQGYGILSLAALLLLIFVFRYFVIWPHQTADEEEAFRIACDAEEIKVIDGHMVFVSQGRQFKNGNTRSSEQARSGGYSSRIDDENKYGMLYEIPDPQPGDRYRVSVWRFGSNHPYTFLTVNVTGDAPFYRQESIPAAVDKSGWVQIAFTFAIPRGFGNGKVSVYVYGGAQHEVFFDDMLIEKIPHKQALGEVFADTTLPFFDLRIEEKQFDRIREKRKEAIAQGILFASEEDWVKGAIMEGESKIPVKLRLKGDWMDHLIGDKWSFRIRTKTPHAWRGLITFSVQNPRVRYYLSEWLYHQFMTREDVLSTRYDFIRLRLNGEPKGIYAYEEHFEKQLPEYRDRREGPILKLEEEGIWNARRRDRHFHPGLLIDEVHNNFEASHIKPFKEQRTQLTPALKQQFELAQELLLQYKLGTHPISEVFDIDHLARYYAITDITQGYHSFVWHNQRFYYNPVLNRLEPIGYDAFTEEGIFGFYNKPFTGFSVNSPTGNLHADLHISPFLDPVFIRRYLQELERLSRPAYIDQFLLDIEPALRAREKALQQEYPNYRYAETMTARVRQIRAQMFPLNDNALQAHTQQKKGANVSLRVANYHVLPIEVVGFGSIPEQMQGELDSSLWLPAYEKGILPAFSEVLVPGQAKYLFFRLPGLDSLYQSAISPWPLPGSGIAPPSQTIFEGIQLKENSIYSIDGNQIRFLPGKHRVSRDIIIPAGYVVYFSGGTELNFVQKAKFVSRSPVLMRGEEDAPIRIHSEDKSANGFTLLQAGEESQLRYVVFDHLNTLDYQGWTLTGAVTFYESPVEIDHCSFLNAHCEDGLNLIRSDFILRNSLIKGSFSDGFDADFCKGKIQKCRFENTGNDGMDLSGSAIEISDCFVTGAGDKGISVGERAVVSVKMVDISQSVTAVASKDLSELHITNIHLRDCETGFTAYQKKPEYGPAKLIVDNFTEENINHLHLVERNSEVILRGNRVEGI